MIIDSHTHVDEIAAWGWIDPPEVLLPLMDDAGIDQSIIMTYRDAVGPKDPAVAYIHDAITRYPDRLIGYIRINPNSPDAMETLDKALAEDGFKGLKLHPVSYVGFPYADAALKLIHRAAEYNAPILFHTGDEAMALPEEVAEAARLCPEAKIIMAHMGGFYHNQAVLDAAVELSNLLVDTSACPYPWMIKRAVETMGAARVLFASDGPGCLPALEVEKVRLAGLSPHEETQVFAGNIQRILQGVRHEI